MRFSDVWKRRVSDPVGDHFAAIHDMDRPRRKLNGERALMISAVSVLLLTIITTRYWGTAPAIIIFVGTSTVHVFIRWWVRFWIKGSFVCGICERVQCNPPEPGVTFRGMPVDHRCAVLHKDRIHVIDAHQASINEVIGTRMRMIEAEVRNFRREVPQAKAVSELPHSIFGEDTATRRTCDIRSSYPI